MCAYYFRPLPKCTPGKLSKGRPVVHYSFGVGPGGFKRYHLTEIDRCSNAKVSKIARALNGKVAGRSLSIVPRQYSSIESMKKLTVLLRIVPEYCSHAVSAYEAYPAAISVRRYVYKC